MSEERVIRINKVLRELNISLDRAVDFLKGKGFDIEATPNAKLTQEEFNILNEQFSASRGKKEASIEVSEEKRKEKEALKIERERELEEKRKQEQQARIKKEQEIIRAKAEEQVAIKTLGQIDLKTKSNTPISKENTSHPSIRINKVLRELNISLDKAVKFLESQGYIIDPTPNAKITQEELNILNRQFSTTSKGIKENSVEVSEEKQKEKEALKVERERELEEKRKQEQQAKLFGIQLLKEKFKIDIPLLTSEELDKINSDNSIVDSDNNLIENINYYILDPDGNIVELNITIPILNRDTLTTKVGKGANNFYKILNLFSELNKLSIYFDSKLETTEFFKLSSLLVLKKLKSLSVNNAKIKSISSLTKFTELEDLLLENNLITTISPINQLVNLKKLSLKNNNISNIEPLKTLTNLDYIDLSYNKIEQLNNTFAQLNNINYLDLSNNLISEISSLKSLIIDKLILNKNRIFDLTALYQPILNNQIKFIEITNNPIYYPPNEIVEKGIDKIRNWISSSIQIANSRIDDHKKNNTKTLDLGNCGLTDLSLIPQLFIGTEHLEELILSNNFGNEGFLDRNFYPNNIINFTKKFSKLTNLRKLIISGDNIPEWNWNKSRLKDISFLLNNNNLEVLDISNNQIESLTELTKLNRLKILLATNNCITKVNHLGKFQSLEELYLGGNKIKDLYFLNKLQSIKTIDLHSNEIIDLQPIISIIQKIGIDYSSSKSKRINVYNNPLDEALINILKNTKESKSRELNDYFDRLFKGNTIPIKRIKLILLGNTQAGKTTLADILAETNKATTGSTHGINFFQFKIGDIDINGYDFGGQDYYHSTHYSFFDEKALYLLIWGNKQQNTLDTNNNNEMLYPVDYWLGSLNKYSPKFYEENSITDITSESIQNHNQENSDKSENIFNTQQTENIQEQNKKVKNNTVINNTNIIKRDYPFQTFLIQNINNDNSKKFLNELDLKTTYDFITDFKIFNFNKDMNAIKLFIDNILKDFVKESRILHIDNKIANKFKDNKSKVILKINEVKALDEDISGYDEYKIDSLLKSLHSILSCFYFKIKNNIKEKLLNEVSINEETLKDVVIIDLEKFTEWIYQILNREDFFQNHNGYFSRNNALEWLQDEAAKNNIDYILAFMLQNKLIFKIPNNDLFFSPNYLSDKQSQAEKLFLGSFEKPIVKYIFNEYFHTSILSEIISNYFDRLVLEDNKKQYVLWKNKLILYDEQNSDQLVYIAFDINNEAPTISISRYSKLVNDEFIIELCAFIESLINEYNYEKLVKSNYDNYIPYNELNTTNKTEEGLKSNVLIYKDKVYKRSDFKMFLSNKNEYPMKKVCISYSKEDLSLVNKFRDYLVPLSDDGLIEDPWYCTDLIAGEKWDDVIKQKFDGADIIFFMISENLMKTKYVKEFEIKQAIDRWNKDNESIKIVPIILEYYHWSREGSYDLAQFTALPYMAKPVTDFANQKMGWYIVVDAIRHMIKNNPDRDTFKKDVLKIFERIAEGKVDNDSH